MTTTTPTADSPYHRLLPIKQLDHLFESKKKEPSITSPRDVLSEGGMIMENSNNKVSSPSTANNNDKAMATPTAAATTTASPMANNEEKAATTTPLKENNYEDDVDHLILSCRSDVEARLLLRGMTVDLLHEVDELRTRLEAKESDVSRLTQERDVYSEDHRLKLASLTQALTGVLEDNSIKTKFEQGQELTSDEAAELVVQSLTQKVSTLLLEKSAWKEQLEQQQDRLDDLTGQNQAYQLKIEALESQFKAINKTRQKVVAQLTDVSNDPRARVSPPPPSTASVSSKKSSSKAAARGAAHKKRSSQLARI